MSSNESEMGNQPSKKPEVDGEGQLEFGKREDLRKLAQNYKEVASALIEMSKLPALVGSLFGLVYLFTYTVTEGIPFPLELSVLPSLMIAVGFIALLFVTVIVFGLVLPSMAQADSSNVEFLSLFVFATQGAGDRPVKARKGRQSLCRYFWAVMLPSLIVVVPFWCLISFEESTLFTFIGVGISIGILIAFSISSIKAGKSEQLFETGVKPKDKIYRLFAILFLTNLFSIFSLLLFILILLQPLSQLSVDQQPFIGRHPNIVFGGILFIFFIFNFLSVVPFGDIGRIVSYKEADKTKQRLQIRVPTVPLFVMGYALLVSAMFVPFGHKLGEAALHTLGIGGGIPEVLCFKDGSLPDSLRDVSSQSDIGCTCQVLILFDAGGVVYLKSSRMADKIYSVKKGEIVVQTRTTPKSRDPKPAENKI